MAEITAIAGRAWVYSHNIGRNGAAGMGFSQPVSIAAANDGVLYVTNRATEQNPGGIRVTKFTVDPGVHRRVWSPGLGLRRQ